jgi:hypothetical protein
MLQVLTQRLATLEVLKNLWRALDGLEEGLRELRGWAQTTWWLQIELRNPVFDNSDMT